VRWYVLLEGVAWVVWFVILAVGVQSLLDYGTRGLRLSIRTALLSVVVLSATWFLWRCVLSPLRLRVALADAASLLERRFPELSSLLVSAVRFSNGQAGNPATNSPALMASVVRAAAQRAGHVDFGAVVDAQRARRSKAALVAAASLSVVLLLAAPEAVRVAWARNVLLQDIDWPRRTRLVVDLPRGELVGARGDDLVIQAQAHGVQPREVEVFFTTASGERGRETMSTVGGEGAYRYRYTFKNAQEDFVFHLRGGDAVTEEYSARLLDRPRVEQSQVTITPPKYTGLAPSVLGDGDKAAQILPGSEVRFSIRANKPVVRAELMAATKVIATPAIDGAQITATVTPLETQTYHFALLDEFGLEDRQPARFGLRVVKDEPPRVRMKLPGVGEMITPEAVLPIELEFADTYGLASADLEFHLTREDTRQGPLPFEGFSAGATTFSTTVTWPVGTEGVTPGDRITLRARAADFDDVLGPNRGESPEVTMRVVTRDELLAELARREQEFRMDFERLIDAQEQLRSRLLTLIGLNDPTTAQIASDVANLERRQRSISGSVNVVRQQVEQVLTEMRINQLATQAAEERLGAGVAEPLARLVKRDFLAAADVIRRWGIDPAGETAQVDPPQAALLAQMRAILANMLQWEGYQEAVTMLRDILRLQQELRTETKDAAGKQGTGVFDE
jgi:hypothetical protein